MGISKMILICALPSDPDPVKSYSRSV